MARIVILDVGHGNAAVVTDNGYCAVIDTGRGDGIIAHLTEVGVQRVDEVLLSHADQDHIHGLAALLAARSIAVALVRANTDSAQGSKEWDDLAYELGAQARAGDVNFVPSLNTNDSYGTSHVHLEILAPDPYLATKGPGSVDRAGRTLTSNSLSAVVGVKMGDTRVALFTGDLDTTGLANMIEFGGSELDLASRVLVFPHHGGAAGGDHRQFAGKLLELARPELVVFSISRRKHALPRPEIVETVRAFGARIACTQLSQHCAAEPPARGPDHLSDYFASGKRARECCAGTLVIDTSAPHFVPSSEGHAAFIEVHATTSLCRPPVPVNGPLPNRA